MQSAKDFFATAGRLLDNLEVRDSQGQISTSSVGTAQAVESFVRARQYVCRGALVGNSGSASIAGPMEIVLCNRLSVRAQVYNEPSVLTALSNDYSIVAVAHRTFGHSTTVAASDSHASTS